MPTAEPIMDTTERLISIPFDSNYKLTGAIIEQCTISRQMVYTTSDIAYIQDIEALNKKIDALTEQSHSNDIQTYALEDNLRDEFATVDKINTVLTNYVQKKDLPPTVDLSEYYNKTESDNKFALKSDVVNVDLTQYATVDDVKEVLTNYVLKSDFDALKAENDNLKAMKAEINNKLVNIYSKEEADNKYLIKENVVNEEITSPTDISYTGAFPSQFTFNNDITINTLLKKGFVFKAQAATSTTIIDFGGRFESFGDNYDGNIWVFANVDNIEHRIIILLNSDKTNYNLKISNDDVFIANYHNRFYTPEWYIESGYKFDSYNVYYIEIVDEKLAAQ